ncbi:allantoate ureidosuccinate permease [Fusarium bulbicola]|nr:allantoate ureidosuccinate permease [Fusarium bulbicola]
MPGTRCGATIKADALDPHFGPKTIAEVVKRLGTPVIDILVNNAILSDPAKSYTRAFAEKFFKLKRATFNSVVVGLTATDSIKASQHMIPPGFLDGQVRDTTARERIGVPDDIAYVVNFLASEEGRWVNGAAYLN